ncbi:MAG: TIGR00725 family protein [Chitinispirillaceae bacterium]|nr:TIGR00725 family protein [Chitinispirillaceae bacterium]
MTLRPVVGVVGSGRAPSEEQVRLAEEVGKYVAQRGAVLVCGGLSGIMEAASRGAAENGGTVVGILPSADKTSANPWVSIAVPTGQGMARNALVVHTADVLIAFPGAFGTLSEMAMALDSTKSIVFLPGAWDLRKAGGLGSARFLEAFDAKQAVGMALGEIGRMHG